MVTIKRKSSAHRSNSLACSIEGMKFALLLMTSMVVSAIPIVSRGVVTGKIGDIVSSASGGSAATAGTDGKASSFAGALNGEGNIFGFTTPSAVLGFVLPSPTL